MKDKSAAKRRFVYCVPCDAGKFREEDDSIKDKCRICAAGKFSKAGEPNCRPCGVGTYSSDGADICTPCEEGMPSAQAEPSHFFLLAHLGSSPSLRVLLQFVRNVKRANTQGKIILRFRKSEIEACSDCPKGCKRDDRVLQMCTW